MPSVNIVVETVIQESFRVAAMRGLFDVPLESKNRHEWVIDIPIENMRWNVGLIVGASGSGKTTIARKIWGDKVYHRGFKWSKSASILDGFPKKMTILEITAALSKVGFSSPPSWNKPFHILSTGEKFRVELARILAEEQQLTVVDEFTSVIDRNVAKIGSFAISKATKKLNKKIICLSCHRDILEWLEPDWVYDLDINKFSRRRLRRPKIKIQLVQVHRAAWNLFKKHHYLTASISNSAQCFVALWDNIPVGFTSFINHMGRGIKKARREHRTVVLPDYQGVGIGSAISDALAEYCTNQGYRFFSTTSHPVFTQRRIKNLKWILKRKPSRTRKDKNLLIKRSNARLTCGFEYKG